MTANARRDLILKILEEDGFVSVGELSKRLCVSEVTVRTDLSKLESDEMVSRTHGGAIPAKGTNYEPSVVELENLNIEAKTKIARKALDFVNDGDTIFLDNSSTCRQLARCIKESNLTQLTIVTNCFRTHWELMECEWIDLIHIGGNTRHLHTSSVGPLATKALKMLRVNKAFLGANGVDAKGYVTTPSIAECEVKNSIMESASEVYLLTDSSKFDKVYLGVMGKINEFNYIITDALVPKKYYEICSHNECKLIIV